MSTSKKTTVSTNHFMDGTTLDLSAANHLAGIEILDVAQRMDTPEALKQVVFEKVPAREIENQTVAG